MQTACAIDLEAVHEGVTHLEWAASVAKAISRAQRFPVNSQEEGELIQVAHMLLHRRAIGDGAMPPFDPSQVPEGGSKGGLFRGSIHMNIKYECIKEARRLRGGGIPGAASRGNTVTALPNWVNELGEEEDEAAIADHRQQDVEEPEEEPRPAPPPAREPQPVASWTKCDRCGNRAKLRPTEPRECALCGGRMAGFGVGRVA